MRVHVSGAEQAKVLTCLENSLRQFAQGKETITSYILRSAYAVAKLISLIGAIPRLHLCKMQGKRLPISQKFAGLDIIGDHARQKG
jgi:hypothetical protein